LYKNDKLSHVRDFADTDITRDEKKANCFQLNYKNGNSETLNGDIRLQPNGNISIEDKGGRTLYQSLNGGGYVRRLYESNDPANHKCCELEYNGKELVGFTKADGNGFYVEPNGAQKIELKNNKVTVQFENKIEEYALLPEKRAAL
jgi:hypothetical protein